jgi:hypothetical protein
VHGELEICAMPMQGEVRGKGERMPEFGGIFIYYFALLTSRSKQAKSNLHESLHCYAPEFYVVDKGRVCDGGCVHYEKEV